MRWPASTLGRYAPVGNMVLGFDGAQGPALAELPVDALSGSFTILMALNVSPRTAAPPQISQMVFGGGTEPAGSTLVTVYGVGFWGRPVLSIDGQPLNGVQCHSPGCLTAIVNGPLPNGKTIQVENPDGQACTSLLPSPITPSTTGQAAAPTVSAFTLPTTPGTGPVPVSITGTGFWGEPTVTIASAPGTAVAVACDCTGASVSPTTITAWAPASLANLLISSGALTVTVTNPDGQSAPYSGTITGASGSSTAATPSAVGYSMGVLGITAPATMPAPAAFPLCVYIDASGQLSVVFGGQPRTPPTLAADVSSLMGSWMSVAISYYSVPGLVTLSVNGDLLWAQNWFLPDPPGPSAGTPATTLDVSLGAASNLPLFAGRVGPVRVWKAVIPQPLLDRLAFVTQVGPVDTVTGPAASGLVASWRMNEGFGDTAFDYAGVPGNPFRLAAAAPGQAAPDWRFDALDSTPLTNVE